MRVLIIAIGIFMVTPAYSQSRGDRTFDQSKINQLRRPDFDIPGVSVSPKDREQHPLFHPTKKDIRGFYLGMTPEQVAARVVELTGGRKCVMERPETNVYPCIFPNGHWRLAEDQGVQIEFTRNLAQNQVWQIVYSFVSQKSQAELAAAVVEQFGLTLPGGDKYFRDLWEFDDGSRLSLREGNLILSNPTLPKLDEQARQNAIRNSPNPKF
jgi:hypothetical protein